MSQDLLHELLQEMSRQVNESTHIRTFMDSRLYNEVKDLSTGDVLPFHLSHVQVVESITTHQQTSDNDELFKEIVFWMKSSIQSDNRVVV